MMMSVSSHHHQTTPPTPTKPLISRQTQGNEKEEKLFEKLGLWEFAHSEFEQDLRLDELAQLVATYDPTARNSIVKGMTIKVSRGDLARALRISPKKEKNCLEIPDSQSAQSHPIENCADEVTRSLLYFISARVLPGDDPCLITEEMVGFVESALKTDQFIDWASLIWSRAEKELLQGKGLEKFYYAWHFQQLIKFQRPKLFDKDLELCFEEGEPVMKTRTLHDLQGQNVDDDTGVQESGVVVDQNQPASSQQNPERPEINSNQVGDAVDPCRTEEHEENERLGDQKEKGTGENTTQSTLRACSIQGTETKESDERSRDSRKSSAESEEEAGPVEVSSQVTHLLRPISAEHSLSETEKGILLNSVGHIERPSSAEHALPEFEKGTMPNLVTPLEKPTAVEHILSQIENGMTSGPAAHFEKCTSVENLVSELERGIPLNPIIQLEKPNSPGHLVAEIDKSTMLTSACNLERPSSAEHLWSGIEKMILNPGPSHSGNARKRETDEDDELHSEPEKKLRSDIPWNFDMCMGSIYEWGHRAQAMHMAEKEAVINRANMEIQHLSGQLQQRDYLIRTLQMGKQEEQQREMEYNNLKVEFHLTNETLRGYIRAMEEARNTISFLQQQCDFSKKEVEDNNAALTNTVESLNQELQQKQDIMVEFQGQVNHFSQLMESTFEKLTSDIVKGMQKQQSLEQQLGILKAEFERKNSKPPSLQ
eukprot:Gb_10451 [translate_table: standard]